MSAQKIVWQSSHLGIVILVAGVVFMVAAFSAGSDILLLALYVRGMLTIGFGFAAKVFAFTIKQLQKQVQLPPPTPPAE